MTMIRYEEAGKPSAGIDSASSLPSMVAQAASKLADAKSYAEILEAKELAGVGSDVVRRATRLEKAKGAHDEIIANLHRRQADFLEIEAMAKRRLADEYDSAQERGEIRGNGDKSFSGREKLSGPEIIPPKQLHEARVVRDAEVVDPGVVRRALDARLDAGEEPTKAALREAVMEAAKRGLRGSPAPSNKNPNYRAPTEAGAAWTHLYGDCRALVEWATAERLRLAQAGRLERADDQNLNVAAIRKAANILNQFVELLDAE